MRTVAVLQARQGSTRLPGKSLLPLAGRPVVLRVAERAAAAGAVDDVVVATTRSPADDALARAVADAGFACVRGSEPDVLDRYHHAAEAARADVVVRVTGDCPLLDPDVVDLVVARFRDERPDYASNVHPPTFPDGLDVEVLTRAALDAAWREATKPSDREHVTPFVWSHAERFRRVNVENAADLSPLRWTLDTPDDLAFVRAVYGALHEEGKIFGMRAVLRLLDERPELAELNRGPRRNEGYARSLREDPAAGSGRPAP